jgi:hypothetical protein
MRVPSYAFSGLGLSTPGLERLRDGFAAKSRLYFSQRVEKVGLDVAVSAVISRLRPVRAEVRRIGAGAATAGNRCLRLYVRWSPSGRVSGIACPT